MIKQIPMQATHTQLILEGQETARLRFRNVRQEDFNIWLQFCNDPDSIQYFWFLNSVEDPKERCRIWFERVLNRYKNKLGCLNALTDKTSGEFVGKCGLLIQNVDDAAELEIGYSILPQHRQKGYAFEAAGYCRDYAFKNNLAESLISIIHPNNVNSANVARKNGMKIDKQTLFFGNPVNIFRITRREWEQTESR